MKTAKSVSSIFFRQKNQRADLGKCLTVRVSEGKRKTSISKIEVPDAKGLDFTNRQMEAYMARPQAKPGARGFEVEWCSHLPKAEFGGADIDNATYKKRDFASRAEAFKFAQVALDEDCFGAVRVTEFVYERAWPGSRLLDKTYISDGEFVEAD